VPARRRTDKAKISFDFIIIAVIIGL